MGPNMIVGLEEGVGGSYEGDGSGWGGGIEGAKKSGSGQMMGRGEVGTRPNMFVGFEEGVGGLMREMVVGWAGGIKGKKNVGWRKRCLDQAGQMRRVHLNGIQEQEKGVVNQIDQEG
ncbi:hypothetical protein Salat_0144200 [Sesamum alatum]|uniref:Uncharacterized protein n=1 Tax=Sesamum alatum TaxID=300844 RepID=A0AAE1YXI5_9LAMI|nr:hypothetical protein Salat_0144200 [Sesamum alatum]